MDYPDIGSTTTNLYELQLFYTLKEKVMRGDHVVDNERRTDSRFSCVVSAFGGPEAVEKATEWLKHSVEKESYGFEEQSFNRRVSDIKIEKVNLIFCGPALVGHEKEKA